MKNEKINHDESLEIFDAQEMKELEKELNQFLVKYPDEQQMNATIDVLREYVPTKRKEPVKFTDRFLSLLQHAKNELSFMSKGYLLASLLIYVIGYIVTLTFEYNPLLTLVILAPLPFVFGLIEVFKGREQGLLEMEMACKFSAYEIMLTRLLIVGLFNVTLNTLLTFGFTPLLDSKTILDMLLVWITPLTLFSAISLGLSILFRGKLFVLSFISLWILFSLMIVSNPMWREFILNMHIALHFLLIGIGIMMLILQLKQIIQKYSSYEEAETVEISY